MTDLFIKGEDWTPTGFWNGASFDFIMVDYAGNGEQYTITYGKSVAAGDTVSFRIDVASSGFGSPYINLLVDGAVFDTPLPKFSGDPPASYDYTSEPLPAGAVVAVQVVGSEESYGFELSLTPHGPPPAVEPTIVFESYTTQHATMRFHRAPRIRVAASIGGVFLLHRDPRVTASASVAQHVVMRLHRAPPRIRISDARNVFLLQHPAPRVTLSGGSPVPEYAVFSLNGRAPRINSSATIGYAATMHFHRESRVLLGEGGARFRLHRPHGTFLYDGIASEQRTAFLLQQPVLVSRVELGTQFELSDGFTAYDAQDTRMIVALRDALRTYDSVASLARVLASLIDGARFTDRSVALLQAVLSDLMVVHDSAESTARLSYELRDGMAAHDELVGIARIMAELRDSFVAYVTLRVGNDVYTAWVMTPETRAMRQYSNWPFNSYAQRPDGTLLAAGPDGVYRLGGETDAGAAITSAVRTGLLDFGTQRMKRIDRSYLGYSSTGDIHLRVCATSVSGTKVEYVYKMIERKADSPTSGRIDIGRGVKSVYWSFELVANDLELHDMTILPMVLTGRFGG